MKRILSGVRMQYANANAYFWVPALILTAAVAITLIVTSMFSADQVLIVGAANAPTWFFLSAGVQAMALVFPFALALGLTRWEFCLSTLMAAVGAASTLALFATILGLIEKWTDGWGLNVYALYLPWFWANGPLGAWFSFMAICVVLFQLGFAFTVVYKRFGLMWLVMTFVAIAALLLIPTWIITATDSWPQTFQFLSSLTAVGFGGGAVVFSLLVTTLGYLALRRYEVR